MKVVVTGGAGFIGSHLTEALYQRGRQVTVLDNLSSGTRTNLPMRPDGYHLQVGDIRDREVVSWCLAGAEAVFHLAAFTSVPGSIDDPETCLDININGTRNLIEAACAAGVRRLILSSTSAVYPEASDVPLEETVPPMALSPYAQSKLDCERMLQRAYQEHGLSYTALRYFNVYGPRQDANSDYAAVIPVFVENSLRNEPLTIYGSGEQTRDFVYVGDVVASNLFALDSNFCGVCNVGTGLTVSVLELAATVQKATGVHTPWVFQPPRPGDALSSTADISFTRSKLGWSPTWHLYEGLAHTIQWYKSQIKASIQ